MDYNCLMKIEDNYEYIFIFGTLFFCILFIVRLFIKSGKNSEKESLEYNEIEEMFFQKTHEGYIPYKFLNIYTPLDLMMIKSLFISEQIPYYTEFEHIMGLRPFVQSINYNNTNFYIIEEDYNDAIKIIEEYIKLKNLNNYKFTETIRGIFEYLMIGWVIPSPNNFLGIEINYKK